MAGLPNKLKNFMLFVDGIGYAGKVKTVTTPKLTRKMEEYQGGTMIGPVKLDLGLEAQEISFNAGGYLYEILSGFGARGVDDIAMRFAGAMQRDDTRDIVPVEIYTRGRYSEIDFGDQTAGALNETKVTAPISYLKITVNGIVRIELDFINMIEKVNGVDLMAAVRTAIGMASIGI